MNGKICSRGQILPGEGGWWPSPLVTPLKYLFFLRTWDFMSRTRIHEKVNFLKYAIAALAIHFMNVPAPQMLKRTSRLIKLPLFDLSDDISATKVMVKPTSLWVSFLNRLFAFFLSSVIPHFSSDASAFYEARNKSRFSFLKMTYNIVVRCLISV